MTTTNELAPEVALAARNFMQASRHLPRLLDIADDRLQLMSDFEAAYEQDPPDLEALARIEAEFDNNEALVIAKLENYIGLDAKFLMFEQAFKARAAELRELAGIAERNRERLRARLLVAMQTMGRDKVVTPSGIVSTRLNPPSVQIVNASLIPPEYWRRPPIPELQVDKVKVLAALKADGECIPGTLVERSTRLVVS